MIILNEIQNKLNELWAGVIDFYEFNNLKQTITFNIPLMRMRKNQYMILNLKVFLHIIFMQIVKNEDLIL